VLLPEFKVALNLLLLRLQLRQPLQVALRALLLDLFGEVALQLLVVHLAPVVLPLNDIAHLRIILVLQ